MKTIALNSIVIPEERQRVEKPDAYIGELCGSIFSETGVGLINAITLRDGAVLVAGECRLRAVQLGYMTGKSLRYCGQEVPPGEIPFIDAGDLDALARAEAEYAENVFRMDFTWQDKARAYAGLQEMLTLRRGVTVGPTEVAKAAGVSNFAASQSLSIARHLGDAEIAKASSEKEAMKILRRKVEAGQREKLAAVVGRSLVKDRMEVVHGNCLEWMAKQVGEQFDVILTDPPYGMDADGFGDGAGRLVAIGHEYADGRDATLGLLAAAIPEFYRLGKPQSHLYLWCDIDLFGWLKDQCAHAGWWVHRTPLVNIKREGGRVPWPDHGPRRAYELCLYAVKGKKPTNGIVLDVFESTLSEGNFGHGAQKPVEAYVNLLKRSVRPGDRVLDAFAGTGTIFEAAAQTQCYAVGVEKEAAPYGICLERVGGLG